MLADRYGLAVSTTSAAARDAYVAGCDMLLSLYPGAEPVLARAIAADPGFALAHAARARALQTSGDMAGARTAIAEAQRLATGLNNRQASHVAFFALLIGGQSADALAALRVHLRNWPRDAVVLSASATNSGLILSSGHAGVKREQRDLMDSLAPHYGEDWWFASIHAFALSETGAHDAARDKAQFALAANPANALAAHALTHVHYESGTNVAGRGFMRDWLKGYPREAVYYGHISWHLALCELDAGDDAEAWRLYSEIIAPDVNRGRAATTLVDATSFLWRWELAGNPCEPARWQVVHDFVARMFPRPGGAFADWHIALAEAAAGDGTALEERLRQIEAMAHDGRYPSGPVVPALARAFAAFQRQDFSTAITILEPMLAERDRAVGSLAQTDLFEFTLLRAYLAAGRPEAARHLLAGRRAGPGPVRVIGLNTAH